MIAVVRTSLVMALLLVSSCSFYLSEPRLPKTDLRATLGALVPPTAFTYCTTDEPSARALTWLWKRP